MGTDKFLGIVLFLVLLVMLVQAVGLATPQGEGARDRVVAAVRPDTPAVQDAQVTVGHIVYAASCEQGDVQAAIAAASSGDTVIVPAGACTWSSPLVITRGLTLRGAGGDHTTITGNVGTSTGLVQYRPSTLSIEADEAFRLTGFTFDLDNGSKPLYIRNQRITATRKIRIDHNQFVNCIFGGSFEIYGTIYGVMDNNAFSGGPHIDNYGANAISWDNLTFAFGSADNFYIEDNTFTTNDTAASGGVGGRYCFRYNTYTHIANRGLYPWFDMHGNMGVGGNYSTMGAEIYGNVVAHGYPNAGVRMFDQRGGKALIFYNQVRSTSSAGAQVREEYDDALNPTTNPQPQHVSDSYYWNNRRNTTLVQAANDFKTSGTHDGPTSSSVLSDSSASFPSGDGYRGIWVHNIDDGSSAKITANTATTVVGTLAGGTNNEWRPGDHYTIENDCCRVIAENSEYYDHNVSFDGTLGVGCGPLAARPATCTPGVGYWATDQDCSTVPIASVGAHPAEPVTGTLYKCTSINVWTPYYQPYAYPHPLTRDVVLAGTPLDRAIHLDWEVVTAFSFPISTTWRIEYVAPGMTPTVAASGLVSATQDYTLTNLVNSVPYTVTLNGMVDLLTIGETPFFTATVIVTPTSPQLTLHGAPADAVIYLTWEVIPPPPTITWRIDYEGPIGDQPPPITGIVSSTRSYTLTGLTNYVWYTVTLDAMLDSTPLLADTVRVMPTDIAIYLPLVWRMR